MILGCPLAGIAADEILDATPVIAEIRDRFVGTTEFSNLPRKYKSSISGCVARCTDPEINDISFVGVEHPELGPGFDLWVGGGLSTNPMFAQRLEAFVEPERAPEAWAAVTSLFREYGYRRSRNQSRLKFLVKDWGAEEFRRVLEKEFLDEPLPDGPAPPPAPMDVRDHVGVHPQLDGRAYVGFAPQGGAAERPPAPAGRRPRGSIRQREDPHDHAPEVRDHRRRARIRSPSSPQPWTSWTSPPSRARSARA